MRFNSSFYEAIRSFIISICESISRVISSICRPTRSSNINTPTSDGKSLSSDSNLKNTEPRLDNIDTERTSIRSSKNTESYSAPFITSGKTMETANRSTKSGSTEVRGRTSDTRHIQNICITADSSPSAASGQKKRVSNEPSKPRMETAHTKIGNTEYNIDNCCITVPASFADSLPGTPDSDEEFTSLGLFADGNTMTNVVVVQNCSEGHLADPGKFFICNTAEPVQVAQQSDHYKFQIKLL